MVFGWIWCIPADKVLGTCVFKAAFAGHEVLHSSRVEVSFMQLCSLLFAFGESREVPLVEGPANFVATYWTQSKSGSDPCLAKQNLSECVVNPFYAGIFLDIVCLSEIVISSFIRFASYLRYSNQSVMSRSNRSKVSESISMLCEPWLATWVPVTWI